MSELSLSDLAAMHAEIDGELRSAIARVYASRRYVGGEEVERFEAEFASFLGVRHAVGVANGTDALQLALLAAGVERGDEVLVPANTFIATAEAVAAIGAIARFVDVHAASGLLDVESCEQRVGARTRAIVPVHLYGRMVEMRPVLELARRHSLVVVEDAAQAHGAAREGSRAGAWGDAGCFSFYPGKNLGALGDAGAAVTDDDAIARRLRLLRDHGRAGRDEHELRGYNSRLDALQAAVLSVKLARLDGWTEARRAVARRYREALPDLTDWFSDDPRAEVHHLFPILAEGRDKLAEDLRAHGIHTGVHYRVALPSTPAFRSSRDDCPVAERRARIQLSLPIHPHLGAGDVDRVVEAIVAWRRRRRDRAA